jgi:hypothetical protein
MTQQVAFVLLDHSATPDLVVVAEAICRRHPAIPASASWAGQTSGNSPLLLCDGEIVAVMSLIAPLPRDEGLLVRASASWPEVRAVFERHSAHLVVSILGAKGGQLRIARVITAVVGGLIAATPGALGVVWGSKVAHPADRWMKMSEGAFVPYPDFPVSLWISIHPFSDELTGGGGAITQGLTAFVGRELELIGAAEKLIPLLERAQGLATYLAQNGPVLKDGSTFGVSETEHIAVRLCMSERFPGMAVLHAKITSRVGGGDNLIDLGTAAGATPPAVMSGSAPRLFAGASPRPDAIGKWVAVGRSLFLTLIKWSAITLLALILLGEFLKAYKHARLLGNSTPRADLYALESIGVPLGIAVGLLVLSRVRSARRRAKTTRRSNE